MSPFFRQAQTSKMWKYLLLLLLHFHTGFQMSKIHEVITQVKQSATFYCYHTDLEAKNKTITWTGPHGPINENNADYHSRRVHIKKYRTLIINEVTTEDQAEYSCEVDSKTYKKFRLTVQGFQMSQIHEVITQVKQSAVFYCYDTDLEAKNKKITWTGPHGPINENNADYHSRRVHIRKYRTLVVNEVTTEDQAEYSCEVDSKTYKKFRLTVQGFQMAQIHEVITPVKQSAIFYCYDTNLQAKNKTITWTGPYGPINENNADYHSKKVQIRKYRTLVVNEVTAEDQAEYSCEVDSKTYKKFRLTVQDPPLKTVLKYRAILFVTGGVSIVACWIYKGCKRRRMKGEEDRTGGQHEQHDQIQSSTDVHYYENDI
ncbi:obscurin-like isoform X2 [Brachyhypopomus gauderio]|uniref:obscurin-like isoform X2 n=1 Tax=Brachyhypopomus gauderio TaxID=698409 RepID=UPI004041388E